MRLSHIMPAFAGRQGRKLTGNRLYIRRPGSNVRLSQQTVREHLLCETCEQEFGRVEARVARNWDRMQTSREILLPSNKVRWIRVTKRHEKHQKARSLDSGRKPWLERWTGVDEDAWRKLAAISAWRMAESSEHGLGDDASKLRELVGTGLWEGERIPLIFYWNTYGRMGRERGDPEMRTVELLPAKNDEGDIWMTLGGFTLRIGTSHVARLNKYYRMGDIQPDGTWWIMPRDFFEGLSTKALKSVVDELRPLHERLTKGERETRGRA